MFMFVFRRYRVQRPQGGEKKGPSQISFFFWYRIWPLLTLLNKKYQIYGCAGILQAQMTFTGFNFPIVANDKHTHPHTHTNLLIP